MRNCTEERKDPCESSKSEEREETDCDLDRDSDYSDDSVGSKTDELEIERSSVIASISVAASGVDIERDEWIAVGYRGWYSLCSLILKFIFYIDNFQILTGLCCLNCL